MPDILRLETPDWALNVWSSNITKSQKKLLKTMQDRNKALPDTQIRFSQPQLFTYIECNQAFLDCPRNSTDQICLPEPIFFENSSYEFEFTFSQGAKTKTFPKVLHRNKKIEESFHFVERSSVLRGTIDTANHIGWLRLPIRLSDKEMSISFEILPTKMDVHADLAIMHRVIDQSYPLWRFSFTEKTEQGFRRSKHKIDFKLLWLAHFERLREQLHRSVKQIVNAPHSRLISYQRHVRSDALKGKIDAKVTENLCEVRKGMSRKHLIAKKRLSIDTLENRFIKHVVSSMVANLDKVHAVVSKMIETPENCRVSDSFLAQISDWSKPFNRLLNHTFFKELGDFTALKKESLVLHQKSGYADTYKIWQILKCYLDFFGDDANVSVKSVDQLYELWCFLEIRRILVEGLGLQEVNAHKERMRLKDFEYKSVDGLHDGFKFISTNGIKVRLAHEPRFTSTTSPMSVSIVSQKPDIYMEVDFPDGGKFIWLFDAKYRIGDENTVPDDAINQMHRYRDAILYNDNGRKYRGVFGAYALYPAYCDQSNEHSNPYYQAINQINIGAFPLLPSHDGQGSALLELFLKRQLKIDSSDLCFMQPSARISALGMTQKRYDDLVMIAPMGRREGRDRAYLDRLDQGAAEWYHIPKATLDTKFKDVVADEVKYLALGVTTRDVNTRMINFVWRVESVQLVKRANLTVEQAGIEKLEDKEYWLFRLSSAVKLSDPIDGMPIRDFKKAMKLVRWHNLQTAKQFTELKNIYPQMYGH